MRSTTLALSGLSTLAAVAATLVPPAVAQAAAPICFGERATITGHGLIMGTPGDDVIVATEPGSEVHAGGGDDRVCGAFLVYGQAGNDLIRFGGNLTSGELSGGPGADRIIWAAKSSDLPELIGGNGDDKLLVRGSGAQILNGGRGADVIVARNGPDLIFGQGGDDVIRAGAGNDDVSGGPGVDRVDGGSGRDDCTGVEHAVSC